MVEHGAVELGGGGMLLHRLIMSRWTSARLQMGYFFLSHSSNKAKIEIIEYDII